MNCEQKSGVFLDTVCANKVDTKCSNCKKDVCNSHSFDFEANNYCENCFWEKYILSKTEPKHEDSYIEDYTTHRSSSSSTSNSSRTTPEESGFKDGFGGGGFGGGGASGSWTEGDMQSLNATNQDSNEFMSNDDTFFYS